MSGTTTCPRCRTRFRVTPQQLAAHGGKVRCGRCQEVFNAFDTLAGAPLPEQPAAPEAEPAPPPLEAGTPPQIFPAEAPPPEAAAAIPERRRSWPWLAGSLLLLLLLPLQGAFFFRDELAARAPELKPLLQQMCALVQCRVSLLHNAELVSIEASDMRQAEAGRPGVVILSTTLRNRARHPLAYPLLNLTLTDTRDQPVARRQFPPAQYLEQPGMMEAGMPAEGGTDILLRLDLADLPAAGYRLELSTR